MPQLLRITTLQFIYTCRSDPPESYMAWGLLLLGYKGLVQISAIFLAFGTRKVKVKGLNDSKYIAAIIYATSVSLVIAIIAFAVLQEWTNVLAGIFSMGFWLAATMIVTLVFFPKVRKRGWCVLGMRSCSVWLSGRQVHCKWLINCSLMMVVRWGQLKQDHRGCHACLKINSPP